MPRHYIPAPGARRGRRRPCGACRGGV